MSKSRLGERAGQRHVAQITQRQLRACEGKERHPSRRNARGKATAVERSSGERMQVYRCPLCSSWHLGHGTKRGGDHPQIFRRHGVAVHPLHHDAVCRKPRARAKNSTVNRLAIPPIQGFDGSDMMRSYCLGDMTM